MNTATERLVAELDAQREQVLREIEEMRGRILACEGKLEILNHIHGRLRARMFTLEKTS